MNLQDLQQLNASKADQISHISDIINDLEYHHHRTITQFMWTCARPTGSACLASVFIFFQPLQR